jgi:hypothetical protein
VFLFFGGWVCLGGFEILAGNDFSRGRRRPAVPMGRGRQQV